MNMNFKRKLPIPMEINEMYPISLALEHKKHARDIALKAVFSGRVSCVQGRGRSGTSP